MKKTTGCMLTALALLALYSCGEEKNDDVVEQPSKDGSIETVLSVTHADSFDILTTTHKVWIKGNLSRTIVQQDTIAALGSEMAETTDSSGNTKQANVKKDYEFYITVK